MTHEDYEGIVAQVLAQTLVERVLEKLIARQKRALVIFTGSDMGAAASLDSLVTLKENGFSFSVLLTKSGAKILDKGEIQKKLCPEELWVEQPDRIPEVLSYEFDTILVPTLTVNAVAHLASAMADTPATAIIFDSMMRGKNVIAAIDGCCPDNALREARGFHMAEPLKQKLRDNMEQIRSYGATLTTAENLANKTLRTIYGGGTATSSTPSTAPACVAPPAPVAVDNRYQGGKVLGRTYLASYPPGSTVWVPQGTLVTQMAKDEARGRNITIQIQA